METSFEFHAGRLLCGDVRDFLEAERAKGRDIRWHESKGWIERTFTIGGADADVSFVRQVIGNYAAQLEAAN